MFFVPCPRCGAAVDILPSAVEEDRIDRWNVTVCDECDMAFDYDDSEVQSAPECDSQT